MRRTRCSLRATDNRVPGDRNTGSHAEPSGTPLLQGGERLRIEQLLPATPGWRAVRALRGADQSWQVEALPVVCWALTQRTSAEGVVDHGVEGVVQDECAILVPHGELSEEIITLLSPDQTFEPADFVELLAARAVR